MHRDDGHIINNSLTNRALHQILIPQVLQPPEDERMMAHDDITPQGHSLIDYSLRHVQTQQCP